MAIMIETINDFRRAMRNGAYIWPGGYPLYFITGDGEALSFKAAKENTRRVLEAIHYGNDRDWQPVAVEINWEDNNLNCIHLSEKIECAFGEVT